ncbi:hypothetical protein BOTBODRAFT_191309 [Botryobasidium botryosum FD-172 SS1]|uniref:Malate dehydrogenase n=1 Tax=Botryobasidium botryosum (strain FD-172 SS1) TaxID=930990 RepID=A0A067M0N3_BOTB1|nr:hypothetical protein BOTBODRAFT_191309 [Botryobasidium botryosum FD-172 SS1]
MIPPMNLLSALLSIVFLSQLVAATPTPSQYGCPAQDDVLQLPDGQSQLCVPPGEKPSRILLGIGRQFYACSPLNGSYAFAGAEAGLYDISCDYGTSDFDTISCDSYNEMSQDASVLMSKLLNPYTNGYLGTFSYVSTESGVSPEWNFTQLYPSVEFVIGTEVGRIPAPTSSQDIDWIQWTNIDGNLARTMFQVETKGGQAPDVCPFGSPDAYVPYVAQYWLFG